MGDWPAQDVEVVHDLLDRALASEDRSEEVPVGRDDHRELAKVRVVNRRVGAARYTTIQFALDSALYVRDDLG